MTTTIIGATGRVYIGPGKHWNFEDENRSIEITHLIELEKFIVKTMNKSTGIGMEYGINREGMAAIVDMFSQVLSDAGDAASEREATDAA